MTRQTKDLIPRLIGLVPRPDLATSVGQDPLSDSTINEIWYPTWQSAQVRFHHPTRHLTQLGIPHLTSLKAQLQFNTQLRASSPSRSTESSLDRIISRLDLKACLRWLRLGLSLSPALHLLSAYTALNRLCSFSHLAGLAAARRAHAIIYLDGTSPLILLH